MSLRIPPALSDACAREGRQDWLASLPTTVRGLVEEWGLDLGEPYLPGGQTAWVAPARRVDGHDVVLKVLWPHFEAEHEADGLRSWAGDGAVRLYAAAERGGSQALLLERCVPGTTLSLRPEAEQDDVIADLLLRLWRAPDESHPFRSLQSMCDVWADEFDARADSQPSPLDPGLVRDGLALFRSLPASADRTVLLSTDLHAENALASEREPWLAIDPKPFVGDPTYDALQHLLNCAARVQRDPRGMIERIADLLGLDRERLRLWLFARCVVESPSWPDAAAMAPRIAPL
jgi:streptomycin 6-kinase